MFALDIPTAFPRLGLTFEAIFKPFGAIDVNPSTTTVWKSRASSTCTLFNADHTGGWIVFLVPLAPLAP
jgi:hypothetical protein